MKPFISAVLAVSALGHVSRAQSINVDFEAAGTAHGLPTPYYGGSASAPGIWNSVSSVSTSGLLAWDGTPTAVRLELSDSLGGCGAPFSDPFIEVDIPGTTGEHEAFLDDRYAPVEFSQECAFTGLTPGDYVVDTILVKVCSAGTPDLVSVAGSTDPTQEVDGEWFGQFEQGVNFARHHVAVTDGTIRIHVAVQVSTVYLAVCGIQLNKLDQQLPGIPVCFGDGTTATSCPCSNVGAQNHGCGNSASTGGAVLFATGTTNPDSVVLHASEELPSALSVFFQGSSAVSPVAYGDGLRCVGGSLKRLYKKSANGGQVVAPSGADPSITVRSAQLGDPIPAGGTRYYHVAYRDPNPSFCAAPAGSTFNATNAVQVNW